jgi:hypothetical protein
MLLSITEQNCSVKKFHRTDRNQCDGKKESSNEA